MVYGTGFCCVVCGYAMVVLFFDGCPRSFQTGGEDTMMRFSERVRLAQEFSGWSTDNSVVVNVFNVLTWLDKQGRLNGGEK